MSIPKDPRKPMIDVTWRSPAEMGDTLAKMPGLDVIILTKDKEGQFETHLICRNFVNPTNDWYMDAPLASFSMKDFNPFEYELLAICDYTREEAPSEPDH